MEADLKAKWVEALRSGKYEQGEGGLRRSGSYSQDSETGAYRQGAQGPDKYCCLGVLCDVSGLGTWSDVACSTGLIEYLVGVFRHRYSLHHDDLVSLDVTTQQVLMDMNDAGKSFAEIADWVEANVPTTECPA